MPAAAYHAAAEWAARRDRVHVPRGQMQPEGWRPAADEECECCARVRSAGATAYLAHCRSVTHVAALYDVDPRDVHRLIQH